MKKIVSVLSITSLFIWILPLGVFIKPSQEKTACGGNRAFHMCTMQARQPEQRDSGSQKISFESASSVEKTHKSASGSGDNGFTHGLVLIKIEDSFSRLAELDFVSPRQLLFPVPVPIPKA